MTMTTHRVLVAGAILVLVSGVIVLLRNNDSGALSPAPVSSTRPARLETDHAVSPVILEAAPAREQVEGQPALVAPQLSELSTTERPPLADALGAPNTPPEAEVKIVLDILTAYYRYFHVFPAGESNQHFVNALLGANKHKLPFIPHDHPRINAKGELVDAWGTPFFFHQNSRDSVQVRGAGPDKILFTADDFIAGKAPPQMPILPAADPE